MRHLVLLLLLGVLASATMEARPKTLGLPYYGSADFFPHWEVLSHQVGPLQFQDQNGRPVTEASLDGHITVINFFFVGCGSLCPTLMGNLARILPAAPEGVQQLSISVTPQQDGPNELATYAREHHLDPRWLLLHGSPEGIRALAGDSLFCADDLQLASTGQQVLHTEKVFLLDRQRHIRGLYNGSLALEVEKLIGDIRLLAKADPATP